MLQQGNNYDSPGNVDAKDQYPRSEKPNQEGTGELYKRNSSINRDWLAVIKSHSP